VAAAGTTGDVSSGGGAPAEPGVSEPEAPEATAPAESAAMPEGAGEIASTAEAGDTGEAGSTEEAAVPAAPRAPGREGPGDAAPEGPEAGSPEGEPLAGIAALPEGDNSASPAPEMSRGVDGARSAPEPTEAPDRVAALAAADAAPESEESGERDSARVYGLEAGHAVNAWQAVRIGAALAFGLLLVFLSGMVWSGYQRRL